MTESNTQFDKATHRKLAVELFNSTWSLLDTKDRTPAQDEEMVHAAHASRYHWGIAGTPKNHARGEWQISRVYATLKRFTPAIHHATLYFDATKDLDLGPFDRAFAYEGLARALIKDQPDQSQKCITQARRIAEDIDEADDRTWLHTNLDEVAAMINAD